MYAPPTRAQTTPTTSTAWPMISQSPFMYRSETLGNEFSVLTCVDETSLNFWSHSFTEIFLKLWMRAPSSALPNLFHHRLWVLERARTQPTRIHPQQTESTRPVELVWYLHLFPPLMRRIHHLRLPRMVLQRLKAKSQQMLKLPIQRQYFQQQRKLKSFCLLQLIKNLALEMSAWAELSGANTKQDCWNRIIMWKVMPGYRDGWIASAFVFGRSDLCVNFSTVSLKNQNSKSFSHCRCCGRNFVQ